MYEPTASASTISRNHGCSRKSQLVPSKSSPVSELRERAGQQRRQVRPHAGGAGEAGALADVDYEADGG